MGGSNGMPIATNVTLNNLSGLDLVRRSRSHVKGHRRGGVCVLRMLLVLFILFYFFFLLLSSVFQILNFVYFCFELGL